MTKKRSTRSELHARLRRVGAAWLFREQRMLLVAEEYALGGGRNADVLGLTDAKRVVPWGPEARKSYPELTQEERRGRDRRIVEIAIPPEFRIIEVKASRADFMVGRRKGQLANDGIGLGTRADYCYLLCPWGIAKPSELPTGWGVLWWWEGLSETLDFCLNEHAERPDKHAYKRVRMMAGGEAEVVALLEGRAYHRVIKKARSYHTLEGEVREMLFRAAPARRLAPSNPLGARSDIHRSSMIQGMFWRLYR